MSNESIEGGGWKGNWVAGERPPGYVKTTERYLKLRELGYRSTADLGQKFIQNYREFALKASISGLTQAEVEELLSKNQQFVKAMDDFEKTLRDQSK